MSLTASKGEHCRLIHAYWSCGGLHMEIRNDHPDFHVKLRRFEAPHVDPFVDSVASLDECHLYHRNGGLSLP
ncbi:Uncharacterized protein TCM_015585 [Theobroma cacao]|uniref:Uncharacterized protein n=1 Tax=Theobroma cacao TaxID=3641 RepID=A0A061G9T8_THECC|nr:Uncharacterized protein TCM_015585 [Theobroma cacao]